MTKKTILHICADIGSDSRFYALDPEYDVILIGEEIGAENYHPDRPIHGIMCNPVCTDWSTAQSFNKVVDVEKAMFLVIHCRRIIAESNPKWWMLENPFNGRLKEVIGKPDYVYQPWEYGSPWTKKTALWGNFKMPPPIYTDWAQVPKNNALYVRPTRKKPSLAFLHKSAVELIPEFQWARDKIKCDADIRSMCSQGFAKAFWECNK